MTCHVAMLGAEGAVMFSDSQASTLFSETHGLQKQCVGKDFLVGGAGHGLVVTTLLKEIDRATAGPLDSTTIEAFIVNYLMTEVTATARNDSAFLVALPTEIKWFVPSVFTRFQPTPMKNFASIGSGAEFVLGAAQHNVRLGITHGTETLVDTFVAVEEYIDFANDSLTVDDNFTVGVLRNGNTYLMGHREIHISFVPPPIAEHWRSKVADDFKEILAIVRTIRSEIREARRQAAALRVGGLQPQHLLLLLAHNVSIQNNRATLTTKLNAYFDWYDQQLGRVPVPAAVPVPALPPAPAPAPPPATPSP